MEIGMLYDIKLPKISCNTINIYLCDRTVSTIDLCHRSHFTAWNHTRGLLWDGRICRNNQSGALQKAPLWLLPLSRKWKWRNIYLSKPPMDCCGDGEPQQTHQTGFGRSEKVQEKCAVTGWCQFQGSRTGSPDRCSLPRFFVPWKRPENTLHAVLPVPTGMPPHKQRIRHKSKASNRSRSS